LLRAHVSLASCLDPTTTKTSTLSLHDALPILIDIPAEAAARESMLAAGTAQVIQNNNWAPLLAGTAPNDACSPAPLPEGEHASLDRKSTRLNSSHGSISYAVFCLKKKITSSTK